MTEEQASVTARVLREAFDCAFAAAPVLDAEKAQNFLGMRIGGDPYAIALSEIAGLFADRKIISLPSHADEFLGVVALRGDIVPVFSLRALLGYAPAEEPARWLVLAGHEKAAFAFDRFDDYFKVWDSQRSSVQGKTLRGHIQATATIAGEQRSIIALHSIASAIATRNSPPLKEQ